MKRKLNRYHDGELFICQGGTYGPKQVEIDPDTLKGEDLKLSKWYDKLPQDGGYRFRAGRFQGKPWAEISIEFRNFCDAVVPWSYVCTAPADEAGKVIKRADRRPEVSLYWAHLAYIVKCCGATMESMYEEPNRDRSWIMNPMPFIDLDHAMVALEKAKKTHPRHICTLEKYDRNGQLVVAIYGWDYGRMERQVDVSLPIVPFADLSKIKARIGKFLGSLGFAPGVSPRIHKEITDSMRYTVVNVI